MSSEVSDARDIRAARRPRLGLSEKSRAARRETLAAVANLDAFVLDRATRAADVAALARATLADVVPARLAPSPTRRPPSSPTRSPRPVPDLPSTLPSSPTEPRALDAGVGVFPRTRPTTSATSSSSARASPLGASLALTLDQIPSGRTPVRRTPPRPLPPQTPRGAAWARDAGLTPPSAAASRPGARDDGDARAGSNPRDEARDAPPSPLGLGRGAHGAAVARRAPPFDLARIDAGLVAARKRRDAAAAAAAASAASVMGKTDASPPRVSARASRPAASPSRGVVSEGLGPSEGFHHLRDPSDLSDEHRVERTLAAVGERLERTPGAIPEGTSSDAVVRRLKAHAAATAATAAMAAGVRKRVASVRGINDAAGSSPSSAGPSSASESESDSEPSASSSSSDSDVSSDGSGSDDERSRASAAPPSRPGVFIPSETETSPKQHRHPPPPTENADAAASDDDVLMDLRRLRARLRREPVSRSPASGSRVGRVARTLLSVESAAATRIQAVARGYAARDDLPRRAKAVAHWSARRDGRVVAGFRRWRGMAVARRRLRARARALRVRFGGGAHYHLGDGAFANGGAWVVVETEGVAGVADRFRAWRRKAFGFVRWREWAAFDAPVAAEAKATEEALRRSAGATTLEGLADEGSSDGETEAEAAARRRRRKCTPRGFARRARALGESSETSDSDDAA